MKKLLLTFIGTLGFTALLQAQTGISAAGTTPDASAMLDVIATDKGMLVPRVALVANNNSTTPVNTPANGLIVYNTATSGSAPNNVTPGLYYWDGTVSLWQRVSAGNALGYIENQNSANQAANWRITGTGQWGGASSKGTLSGDQGSSIELGGTGSPYIDISNATGDDFDARIQLTGNDYLNITGTNLGIDVASPANKLEINGSAKLMAGGELKLATASANERGFIQAVEAATNGGAGGGSGLIIATSGGENIAFKDGGLAGTENMTIAGNGRVGIGATSPLGALDIRVAGSNGTGKIYTAGDNTYPRLYMGGSSAAVAFVINRETPAATMYFGEDPDGGGFQFRGTGTTRIGSLGNGSNTRVVVADASGNLSATTVVGSGIITGSGTTDYLARWTSASTLGTGATRDDGTNVGIGVAPGTFKLNVAGDVHANKFVVQNATNGTNGKGIWMWTNSDSNWGIYMATSGAGVSLANGTATTGAGGATSHSIRIRTYTDPNNSFIYENSSEQLNFSVRASDGMGYFRGNLGIQQTTPGSALHIGSTSWSANQLHFSSGWGVAGYHATIGSGYTGITASGIMLGHPHIPWRSGIGSIMRYASDQAATTYWDLGLAGATDRFDLTRGGAASFLTVLNNGNVGIATSAPSSKFDVHGKTTISRDGDTECCGNDATLALAESTSSTARRASISFHNGGEAEGSLRLIQNAVGSVNTNSRRIQLYDNQSQGMGLEFSGGLFYGNQNSRSYTRDNAGLRGDAGAQSGFYETSSPSNFYSGANSWQHLIDVRHSNPANNYAMQIAGSFFDQDVYVRKTNDNASQSWARVITSRDIVYLNQNDAPTYSPNYWATVSTSTGNMTVKSGDVIKFDGAFNARYTGGSNNDYIHWRIYIENVSGCGNYTTTQMDYFHVTEAGADHDNFKPIPIADYWVSPCNGTVRFYIQAYFSGDDTGQVYSRRLIATRY